MVPASLESFFAASAGVAGALIGLLFVAISVSSERLSRDTADTQLHRIRARAALTSFLNALSVSLFALIPEQTIGYASASAAGVGLLFIAASMLSLIRLRQVRWATIRDGLFLIGLTVTFVVQLIDGVDVISQPGNRGAVDTIAILVIVCFLVGIARSWELIGGPSIGITREVAALVRNRESGKDAVER